MCLIVVKPKGIALPKREYLFNGQNRNSDGIGVAYVKAGTNSVRVKKDFKGFMEFYSWLLDSVGEKDSLIVHFRLATSGLTDEGNRHPFPITTNAVLLRKVNLSCRRAAAHNGILSHLSGHKKYSDTQKFVLSILAPIKNKLGNKSIQKLISSYLNGDKLAIIDYNGGILLFGSYEKENGCYYSNDGYKNAWPYWGYSYYNDSYKSIKKYKNEGLYISECDICQKRKPLREMYHEGIKVHMCKKCRKLSRKGKLTL